MTVIAVLVETRIRIDLHILDSIVPIVLVIVVVSVIEDGRIPFFLRCHKKVGKSIPFTISIWA
jgi:hypothetical protein